MVRNGGIPVLQPLPPLHGRLPEESHTSNAYILLHPDGTFRMLRWYDKRHLLRMELDYHPEPTLIDKAPKCFPFRKTS